MKGSDRCPTLLRGVYDSYDRAPSGTEVAQLHDAFGLVCVFESVFLFCSKARALELDRHTNPNPTQKCRMPLLSVLRGTEALRKERVDIRGAYQNATSPKSLTRCLRSDFQPPETAKVLRLKNHAFWLWRTDLAVLESRSTSSNIAKANPHRPSPKRNAKRRSP